MPKKDRYYPYNRVSKQLIYSSSAQRQSTSETRYTPLDHLQHEGTAIFFCGTGGLNEDFFQTDTTPTHQSVTQYDRDRSSYPVVQSNLLSEFKPCIGF